MKESKFQSDLIKEIKTRFPDSIVLKNDASYCQGVPDLIILNNKNWATLECKKDSKSSHRPNQDYYVDKMNKMSFSAFICPENQEDILNAMERSFKSRRMSRNI